MLLDAIIVTYLLPYLSIQDKILTQMLTNYFNIIVYSFSTGGAIIPILR